jgi:hypothetical protein
MARRCSLEGYEFFFFLFSLTQKMLAFLDPDPQADPDIDRLFISNGLVCQVRAADVL